MRAQAGLSSVHHWAPARYRFCGVLPDTACHCEPVVLRAANQNLNNCRWQLYISVAHTGVAIRIPKPSPSGGAPRSESKSNNCQWQLLHNVKVARASPASARRMRALPLPMGEVPRRGGEDLFCPLSHCVTALPKWEPRRDGLPRRPLASSQ